MDIEEAMITLNVGGTIFQTSAHTLLSVADSRLYKLAQKYVRDEPDEAVKKGNKRNKMYFFDRNPVIFEAILEFYRNGELHLTTHTCKKALVKELRFWEISEQDVSFCCQQLDEDSSERERDLMKKFEKRKLGCAPPPEGASRWKKVQYKVYSTLEKPTKSIPGKVYGVISVLAILVSICSLIFSTVIELRVPLDANRTNNIIQEENITNPKEIAMLTMADNPVLQFFDIAVFVFFFADIVLRFVFCPNKKVFFKTSYNLIDISCLLLQSTMVITLSVIGEMQLSNVSFLRSSLPFFLFTASSYTLRMSRIIVFCMHDVLIVKVLILSLLESWKVILLMAAMMSFSTLVFGPLAYLADYYNPDKFLDMPIACWWAIVTMTTVGYGDQYPGSFLGYAVGSLCALTGLVLTALPIAVIGNRFNELHNFMKEKEEQRAKMELSKGNKNLKTPNSSVVITNSETGVDELE